jgi:hypothetical protein
MHKLSSFNPSINPFTEKVSSKMIQTFSSVLLVSLLGLLSWVIHVAIQRLVLSPIASIPGPRLAAVTYWYEIYYDAWKPGQYAFKIKRLHEEYGASSLAINKVPPPGSQALDSINNSTHLPQVL